MRTRADLHAKFQLISLIWAPYMAILAKFRPIPTRYNLTQGVYSRILTQFQCGKRPLELVTSVLADLHTKFQAIWCNICRLPSGLLICRSGCGSSYPISPCFVTIELPGADRAPFIHPDLTVAKKDPYSAPLLLPSPPPRQCKPPTLHCMMPD